MICSGTLPALPDGSVAARPCAADGSVEIVGRPTLIVTGGAVVVNSVLNCGFQTIDRPSCSDGVAYENWLARNRSNCRPIVAEAPRSIAALPAPNAVVR